MGETRTQGKWSWAGMVCTFTFPSGKSESFDTSEYPGNIRQFCRMYGDQQKLADGSGGKDLTEDQKAAKMRKTYNHMCLGYWRDPSVTGKGGIKKSEFDAEKAKATAAEEKATAADARADAAEAKVAAMEKMMAEMAATLEKLTKKGRK